MIESCISGKNITVIGSQPSLRDNVSLILFNLDPDESGGVRIQGIETENLTSQNAGDVVISPDSLLGGHVYGLESITQYVREKVGNEIPTIVLYMTHTQDISSAPGIERALGIRGIKNLLVGLKQLLTSKE